jgi:mono/diheme cytochrome c family protein
MTSPVVTGISLLVGALVAAVLIVIGLYRWDVGAREAEAALRPAPVAQLALPADTPAPRLVAASPAAPSASPASSADDVAAGKQVFSTMCNPCHPNANAGIGPALHGSAFATRYPDDAAVTSVVRQGKGQGRMPAFAASQLSDVDLSHVVAYLRSLGAAEPASEPTPTPRPPVRGG